jgi:hypothetical protein
MKVYNNIEQGTQEWFDLRCGILTASEVKRILTPTLKVANNDKSRAHVYELASQRVSKYVEPSFVNDDMLRGTYGEVIARDIYSENYGLVEQVGFITEDKFGFTIGYSPDGLVGADGLIEIKSPKQKNHFRIMADNDFSDYILQIQTGLLITGRKWCDFISYCGGMALKPIRVYPDTATQSAIVEAASILEVNINEKINAYMSAVSGGVMTERIVEESHDDDEYEF